MEPEKHSFTTSFSEEMLLIMSGFPRKGHVETFPLTDDDRAAHARAVAAYEEVMSNPWIDLSGYEYDFNVLPLEPHRKFVPEETHEEHLARWIEAGRPMRSGSTLRDMWASTFDRLYVDGVVVGS